uniref:Transposase n=1 Tax=Acrobeloides nanus TaxID=290746 RepID=A0A914EQS8_9BILA
MKSLKNLREAIIRAHNRGKGQREIADFLGISSGTVNKAIKRFEETGSYEDRPGRDPKKTARSQENVQRALEMLQQDRSTKTNSTRKLAKKLGVGKDSVRRILHMDLKRKPYKMLKRQKLTAAMKLKRLQRAQALKNLHKLKCFHNYAPPSSNDFNSITFSVTNGKWYTDELYGSNHTVICEIAV